MKLYRLGNAFNKQEGCRKPKQQEVQPGTVADMWAERAKVRVCNWWLDNGMNHCTEVSLFQSIFFSFILILAILGSTVTLGSLLRVHVWQAWGELMGCWGLAACKASTLSAKLSLCGPFQCFEIAT